MESSHSDKIFQALDFSLHNFAAPQAAIGPSIYGASLKFPDLYAVYATILQVGIPVFLDMTVVLAFAHAAASTRFQVSSQDPTTL